MNLFKALLVLFSFLLFFSCSKDDEKITPVCDGSNLTYNSGIAAIINANCTASNCHNSGSANGSWTSYAGMQGVISSGAFNSRVLSLQDMPRGSATLSQGQLNQLKCWVDNGYPEN
jgi:hypothetical protein